MDIITIVVLSVIGIGFLFYIIHLIARAAHGTQMDSDPITTEEKEIIEEYNQEMRKNGH